MSCGATFPLILTFSPREKEQVMGPAGNTNAALIGLGATFPGQRGTFLPFPRERAGVRGKNASQNGNYSIIEK
jgi:hypothetical protein